MNSLLKINAFWAYMAIAVPGLFLVSVSTGFNGLYGQDSFEYLRYSRALHEHLITGAPVGTFFWPVLYPLMGSLFSFLLPDILSLQLISILCYGLTGFYLEKILVRLFPGKEPDLRVFIYLFYSMSPFILRYSLTVMSELSALFLITAFFYHYLRYCEDRIPANFLWLVVTGTAAVITRYPAIILIFVPFLHSWYLFLRNFKVWYFSLAVTGAGVLVLAEFVLHGHWSGSIFARPHFAAWSPGNFFSRSFLTSDGNLEYTVPNILYVLKGLVFPGFIFAGVLFLIFFKPRDLKGRFLSVTFVSWVIYTVFLAGLTFQNDRILLLEFPLVMVLYAGSFLRVSTWLRSQRPALSYLVIILVVLVQIGLFVRAFVPFYKDNLAARIIAEEIRKYPGKTLYTFNIDQALHAYHVPNPVINLYLEQPEHFKAGELVLFNTGSFSRQWAGFNPMINWERLNAGHHLKVLKTLPEGWTLYEIRN